MRVALVTTSYPASASDPAGHFVRAEALARVTRGDEVVVLAPGGRPLGDGVDVIGIAAGAAFGWPGVVARVRDRPLLARHLAGWAVRTSRALVHAGPFSRVIAHWAMPSGLLVAATSGVCAPLELVSHGGDVRALVALPSVARAFAIDTLVARAEQWRFVAPHLLDTLCAAVDGALADRVRRIASVAACAIELPDVRARVEAIRAARTGRFVCSVGRLVASKRVDRVVRYAARVHADKRLVVVGDGPERARLERLARSCGVRVRFTGALPRDEALAWMGASEALLFASEAEGASTVLREADALGVRVERVGGSERGF